MATKKVSYKNLLKEAISEFTDVAKHAEVKGPFLDGILKWDGGGELPTTQDAASILERYYFNEDQDADVEVTTEDEGSSAGASMKNAKGAGTEQAGTSDANSVAASKTEKEKEIAKEQEEVEDEKEEEVEEQEEVEDEPEEEEVTEDIENAVIEKLIAEMEEEDEDEEKVEEGETMAGKKDFDGVAAGMEATKEKKSKNPEEDTTGAGTEQAGTGTNAGKVPNRKDVADSFVKPKNYSEQEDAEKPEGEEEEEELDVDKKIKEDAGVGGGPIKAKGAMGKPGMGEDEEDIEEAFQIFKEQIEDEEEEAPEEEEVKEQEEVEDKDKEEGEEEEVKV